MFDPWQRTLTSTSYLCFGDANHETGAAYETDGRHNTVCYLIQR